MQQAYPILSEDFCLEINVLKANFRHFLNLRLFLWKVDLTF